MTTTWEPDEAVNIVSFAVPNGYYTIARVDDHWILQGGPRQELNQTPNPHSTAFGDMYDLMMEYASALADNESALLTTLAGILPPPE